MHNNDLRGKTTFDGGRPSMEDDRQWRDFEIPLCHIPPLRSFFFLFITFLAEPFQHQVAELREFLVESLKFLAESFGWKASDRKLIKGRRLIYK